MTQARLDRFLNSLRERLMDDESFKEDISGTLEVPLHKGGLSGTIKITSLNHPRKEA